MHWDKKNINLRASEEREEAIQAETKAVSEGQSNAPVLLIRLDGLAVRRDALYCKRRKNDEQAPPSYFSLCSA